MKDLKRALFVSPDKQMSTEMKKKLLKRKLFSSSEKKKKPLSDQKVNNILENPHKRRKLEGTLKCPRRSLTFDDSSYNQPSITTEKTPTRENKKISEINYKVRNLVQPVHEIPISNYSKTEVKIEFYFV